MVVNSSSSLVSLDYCSEATVDTVTFIVHFTNIFCLLPLSILVLYLGHQRWRQKRPVATASHSDIFAFHAATIELIFALGVAFHLSGKYFGLSTLMNVGYSATSSFYPGQLSFHILTCVECYLAVVHPIIYLGLRRSGGVRIRNLSIACVWLFYCVWTGVTALYFPVLPYPAIFSFLVLSLVIVTFCNLSVLCLLTHPGPGESGRHTGQISQSKQRAFHTITSITCVLWLYFLGVILCVALESSHLLSHINACLVLISGTWFTLPSSLVLPLLFLQRAGKLRCCHWINK